MSEKNKYKSAGAHKGGPGGPGARGGFQKPKNAGKTIKRLLTYLFHRKAPIVLVLLCLLLSTVCSISGTYMLRPIINHLLGSGSAADKVSYLAVSLVKLLLIFILGSICTYVQSAAMAVMAQRSANKLRNDLFGALEGLPLSYFDKHTHGELMSRFTNDADNVAFAM